MTVIQFPNKALDTQTLIDSLQKAHNEGLLKGLIVVGQFQNDSMRCISTSNILAGELAFASLLLGNTAISWGDVEDDTEDFAS